MASNPATNPDTLVSLKINIDGVNKRFKLPLRDLGASTLPAKLRDLLDVSPTADALFERYSDSAAAFVALDPNNSSVYKQLYRAAKAKLKLRLRATVTECAPVVPKPATVEDEIPSPVEETPAAATDSSPSPPPYPDAPGYFQSIAELQRDFEGLLLRGSSECPVVSSTPTARAKDTVAPKPAASPATDSSLAAAREQWFAELAGVSHERQNAIRNRTGAPSPATAASFSVYCNSCQGAIPDEHYHCSTCDEGDFDLCPSCVDNGLLCRGDHWLIKRFVRGGKVITSTTETIAPRPVASESRTTLVQPAEPEEVSTRTCNCCIQEWSDENFVTCTVCEDYDLCIPCHVALKHGHDPKHAFIPTVEDAELGVVARALLAPGRNQRHNAICDGCDKYIYGVRHKCMNCPDWDYCSACVVNASFVHPLHKFIPMYEPSPTTQAESYIHRVRHHGIYCDGPLCNHPQALQSHITGVRYKCAVCHDVDFCASCEASPANRHNKTHPLIKFKTPVRNVSVTTMGDHEDGRPMPIMGDVRRNKSQATETTPAANAATQVQTVADLKPTQASAEETPEAPEAREAKELPAAAAEDNLVAHFIRDAVPDGTVFAPNTVFEQTWYLRNGGTEPWPAGCTVKFTGGDNMCAVDPQHPASIYELVSAGESTTCYTEVAPGQEAGFTVLLRTASKPGTGVSYWRLTTPSGGKFGHRLWCEVVVREPSPAAEEANEETASEETKSNVETSQMIFPTLEKESPESSFRVESKAASEQAEDEADDFEEFTEETLDEETEDGFMTDEEYDILDASDEEYLAEQEKAARK